MSSSLELSEVLKQTVRLTTDAMGAKACSLRLLDESGRRLELVAVYGLSDAYVHKGPVELEKSLIDREVMEGRVLAIADAAEDSRWQYPEEARREGIRSVLSSPLSVKGKTIGTIRVYTAETRDFTDREIQFLSALASQAALSIDNAKLHRMCLRSYQEAVEEAWKKTDVWGSGR
ncbi:MAG TPA: GAF domain-containing protein [Candidatus Bathyarchaeia archaeon]|nr:GAF domain-containing protein [Candidatus Bathyarchaeia archaeon]